MARYHYRSGKRYEVESSYSHKSEAKYSAAQLRKRGYNAAVFTAKAYGHNKNYEVGKRKKK